MNWYLKEFYQLFGNHVPCECKGTYWSDPGQLRSAVTPFSEAETPVRALSCLCLSLKKCLFYSEALFWLDPLIFAGLSIYTSLWVLDAACLTLPPNYTTLSAPFCVSSTACAGRSGNCPPESIVSHSLLGGSAPCSSRSPDFYTASCCTWRLTFLLPSNFIIHLGWIVFVNQE